MPSSALPLPAHHPHSPPVDWVSRGLSLTSDILDMLLVGDLTVTLVGSTALSCDPLPTTQLPRLVMDSFLPHPPVFFDVVAVDPVEEPVN